MITFAQRASPEPAPEGLLWDTDPASPAHIHQIYTVLFPTKG